MNQRQTSRGFTLIELMVVVTIIGILMAAGILAFTNAQQGARDSGRKADVTAIGRAMEQYYGQNNTYPTGSVTTAISPFFPKGSLPTDAKGNSYNVTVGTGTTFCACAQLERSGQGNASGLGSGGACTYQANGNYFCVSQRQ